MCHLLQTYHSVITHFALYTAWEIVCSSSSLQGIFQKQASLLCYKTKHKEHFLPADTGFTQLASLFSNLSASGDDYAICSGDVPTDDALAKPCIADGGKKKRYLSQIICFSY